MLDNYYEKLTAENKRIAIKRIAARNDVDENSVQKALEEFNPLMDIQNEVVVININSYRRVMKLIFK